MREFGTFFCILYNERMTHHKKIYGILGHPVEHSLSPAMHTAAFAALGITAEYHRFDVAPEDLRKFCFEASKKYAGFSVTTPHKENIIPFLDEVDPVAAAIGAVNTVVNEEGRLVGFNTDWIGVQKAFQEAAVVLKKKNVLILGAGGAARAIIYACMKAGAHVTVSSRTDDKAAACAKRYNCAWAPSKELQKYAETAAVIINATGNKTDELIEKWTKKQVAMDCTYNPPETVFLQQAKKAGAQTLNGLGMLLYQGVAQSMIWTKQTAPIEAMREALA